MFEVMTPKTSTTNVLRYTEMKRDRKTTIHFWTNDGFIIRINIKNCIMRYIVVWQVTNFQYIIWA